MDRQDDIEAVFAVVERNSLTAAVADSAPFPSVDQSVSTRKRH
jgi:hypothetical protein